MFSTITTAIIDKLNSEDVTKIQVAYRTDRSTLEGFPAAVVSKSNKDSDYASTSSDRLVYAFKIMVYYPIKNESEQDSVEVAMEETIDELTSVFRSRDALGSACDWTEPIPAEWLYEERADGLYRLVVFTLRCVKYEPNQP